MFITIIYESFDHARNHMPPDQALFIFSLMWRPRWQHRSVTCRSLTHDHFVGLGKTSSNASSTDKSNSMDYRDQVYQLSAHLDRHMANLPRSNIGHD
jgi:hypothetical protein